MDANTVEYQCAGCWRLCKLLTDRSGEPEGCICGDVDDEKAEWRQEHTVGERKEPQDSDHVDKLPHSSSEEFPGA